MLVLVDDLGWMDLACQGSKYFETPHIDRLAAQGMRFTNGYAACAVCSPTRAAVLTGRYPARVGVTDWIRARFQGGRVPPAGTKLPGYVGGPKQKLLTPRNPLYMELDEVTLAEALAPAGYTSCHIGKWHLGPDPWYPGKQGFAFNFGGCDLGQPLNYFDPYTHPRLPGGIPTLKPREAGEYLADREADEAVGFIRAHRDKPFFLYLANYEVHTPIQAKKDVTSKYAAKQPAGGQKNPTYAAMVESVDDAVGRVMKTLDELDLTDRTVVIFTSDNGGLLGPTDNKPLRSGKGYPWEGGIRVPLIVRWPGVTQPGTTSDVPVCSIDCLPTIVSAAKAPTPLDREIDGVDLRPALAGKSLPARPLYWHFPHYRGRKGPYSIVRDGDWKLIKWYLNDELELYDLAEDLAETKNLATEMSPRAKSLSAQLDGWLASVGAKLPKENPAYRAP